MDEPVSTEKVKPEVTEEPKKEEPKVEPIKAAEPAKPAGGGYVPPGLANKFSFGNKKKLRKEDFMFENLTSGIH